MTYLDYLNQFHRVRRHSARRLTSNAADLYFHLLHVANTVGWKPSFNEGTGMLLAALGMTDKTLDAARKLLIEVGLLAYTPGRKGTSSAYELLTIGQDSPPDSAENFRSNGGRIGGSNRGEMGGESGDLHKNKIKTKKKGADAPEASAKKSGKKTTPPVAPPPPAEPEPWLSWVLANAPDVQTMQQPLTAEQWGRLVADFGEPLVQEVLQAIHNTAGATGPKAKYKSAYLTAQTWCKRRCPDGKPPRPAPAAPASSALDEPELNHEEIAQREAAQQADLAARRRHLRTQATAA